MRLFEWKCQPSRRGTVQPSPGPFVHAKVQTENSIKPFEEGNETLRHGPESLRVVGRRLQESFAMNVMCFGSHDKHKARDLCLVGGTDSFVRKRSSKTCSNHSQTLYSDQ